MHEGVAPAIVRAALSNDAGALGPRLDLARRFAMAVAAHADESEDLRRQMVAEIGDDALVDLALAIAGVRVYPTIKRALGYATSCKLMEHPRRDGPPAAAQSAVISASQATRSSVA